VRYISVPWELRPSHQQEVAWVPTVRIRRVSSRSRSFTWEGQVGSRRPLTSSLPPTTAKGIRPTLHPSEHCSAFSPCGNTLNSLCAPGSSYITKPKRTPTSGGSTCSNPWIMTCVVRKVASASDGTRSAPMTSKPPGNVTTTPLLKSTTAHVPHGTTTSAWEFGSTREERGTSEIESPHWSRFALHWSGTKDLSPPASRVARPARARRRGRQWWNKVMTVLFPALFL